MLRVARIARPQQKAQLLADFDPQADLWVVSDLRSKIELQKQLMKSRPGLPGDCILRSSELWTQLLKSHSPRSMVLGREWIELFAQSIFRGQLENSDIEMSVDLLQLLVPVFYHENCDEILRDLIQQDPSAQMRWGRVLDYARLVFNQVTQRGWIAQDWLAAALTEAQTLQCRITGRLIFDLGASLSSSEGELIRRLSENHEVTVILPRPPDWKKNDFLLQPGQALVASAEELRLDSEDPRKSPEQEYRRFSGRTAEIKDAVSQVRRWLDEGVAIERISIITPNFEKDFPVLAEYLRVEGVPLDRALSERLQTHRHLQKWSAKLRLWKEDLDYQDLVMGFQDGLPIRSEEFSARLKAGLFHSDLERVKEVRDAAESWRFDSDPTSLAGFFKRATSLWGEAAWDDLEPLFESLNERTPPGVQFPLRDWISWMEIHLSRLESPSALGGDGRLAIAALQSSESFVWTHRIFLSLVDPLPDRKATALLTADEVHKLGWDYGFFLPHPEQKLLQFEFEWALRSAVEKDVLSYPMSDWAGQPTSPQPSWLAGRGNVSHEADIPGVTRWDEIQIRVEAESPPEMIPGHLQTAARPSNLMPQTKDLRLSASSVQRFGDCPFIFASEKLFGLVDPPLLDLELDRRSGGQLQHAFLEKLTEPPVRWDRSEAELDALLESLRVEAQDLPLLDSFWRPQKRKWIELGLRFQRSEKAWFEEYPQSRIVAREHGFSFVYSPQSGQWRRGERQNSDEVLFQGRLDRVDGFFDGSQLKAIVLYDYKAKVKSEQAFSKWLTENEIQMAFYSWAAEKGLIETDWAGKVAGAVFYDLKTFERETGVLLPEFEGRLYPRSRPAKIEKASLHKAWEDLQREMESRIEKIRLGDFRPLPRKPENCDFCTWKGLCRAPHLN